MIHMSDEKLVLTLLAITIMAVTGPYNAASAGLPVEESKAVWVFPTRVRITNSMSDDKQVLMHCKSKDDDLGERILLGGQYWEWKFHVNIGESTLFYCSFDTMVGSGTFEVFSASYARRKCPQHCNWKVKDDGVHGYHEKKGNEVEFYPWDK